MKAPSDPPADIRHRGTTLLMRMRMAVRADRPETVPDGWSWSLLLAVLTAWTMIATWAGGRWLHHRVDAEAARVAASDADARLAHAVAGAEHRALASLAARPGVARMIDELARVLPPDDRLARLSQAEDRRVEMEVITVDPARLRSALRRSGQFVRLRTTAERRSEGGMTVTLAGAVP